MAGVSKCWHGPTLSMYGLSEYICGMLTVSLHGIRIHAPYGLYPQEHFIGNDFEVDVDLYLETTDGTPWPFADYSIVHSIVADVFKETGQLLETFVQNIYARLKVDMPPTERIRVAVRKLHPPMSGDVGYSQVCYEA